ncbi:MAG: hypothetical protein WEG36_15315 [Gemmatimonadota bacterium]
MAIGKHWMDQRREDLERMFGPRDESGGGFYILLFPLYGPILGVLLYPLATGVMFAAGGPRWTASGARWASGTSPCRGGSGSH